MDSKNLKLIFIVVLSMFFAIYLGIAAATAQFEAIAWVVGVMMVVGFIAIGKHIWILIPLSIPLAGGVNALPGSPPVWWAAMAACGTMFAMRIAVRRSDLIFRFTWLDFAVLLQFLAVFQAWVRNPAGLSVLGGDSAGGKAYIAFGFATVAYFLLGAVRTDLKWIKIVAILSVFFSMADGILSLLSDYIPALAAAVLPFYSGVNFGSAQSETGVDFETQRATGGASVGTPLAQATFSFFTPLTTFNPLRPLRFLMLIVSILTVAVSGFRSAFGLIGLYFMVGSLIRKKPIHVIAAGVIAFLGLIGLVGTNSVHSLPNSAQRILSFLPVDVDPGIRENGDASTDWRIEMWMLALTTDRYIHNKFLGDGFSYSAQEQQLQMAAVQGDKRAQKATDLRDALMLRGSYHGFHVETIKITGYIGLALAIIGMAIMFKSALRLINYFRDDLYWPYVIYFGMPFLITPFYYLLIFGSYRTEFPRFIIMAGMLKLLDNIRYFRMQDIQSSASRTNNPLRP